MQFKTENELPTGGGSKNFLKLKDKEAVEGVFKGHPHEFFILWEGNKSKPVAPGTPESKFRFRLNFLTKEGSVWIPKIFEQGVGVYKQLSEINSEYSLEETVVKITRNGTGTDTTYSILPLLKKALDKATLEHLKTIELLPLDNKTNTEKELGF